MHGIRSGPVFAGFPVGSRCRDAHRLGDQPSAVRRCVRERNQGAEDRLSAWNVCPAGSSPPMWFSSASGSSRALFSGLQAFCSRRGLAAALSGAGAPPTPARLRACFSPRRPPVQRSSELSRTLQPDWLRGDRGIRGQGSTKLTGMHRGPYTLARPLHLPSLSVTGGLLASQMPARSRSASVECEILNHARSLR